MIEFLWDATQQRQINEAGTEAASAQDIAKRAADRLNELERRVDALTLTCQSLWELSHLKLGITEKDLLKKIHEIDLRDERPDGRIGGEVGRCPRCSQTTSSLRRRCVYCGQALLGGEVFRKTL
jgi:hypothetical protein